VRGRRPRSIGRAGQPLLTLLATMLLAQGLGAAQIARLPDPPSPQPREPNLRLALRTGVATPRHPIGADASSQQCGGILDVGCTIASAVVTGPVALMGTLDGSPDPAHIDPQSGAITNGPWRFITTMVGTNPVVDNYDGSLGGPPHECGAQGCIPWVETFDHIAVPLCLGLVVLALLVQLVLFMAGQQLQLRRHVLPSLVVAAALSANLPLHVAGRIVDAGSWVSQALVAGALQAPTTTSAGPLNMMTVLALTAYCPADSPIAHPGIHLSWPGSSPQQAVLVKPWMDPHDTQSHCIASSDPDFTKEVTDRSDNIFGPPLHDLNCDATVIDPSQPLCTNVDNTVNDNHDQDCLEGSGSSDGVPGQLGLLPLPGEPRAGNGQRAADCRYADIYWGTTPTFTNVWSGVGPHGRNGYDVPDGLVGMVAFTVLTGLGVVLAFSYLVRYVVLALLAAFSAFALLALTIPGAGGLFSRWLRVLIGLSLVVVVQTAVFLVFVAVVSTASGLAPSSAAAGCPVYATAAAGCAASPGGGLLAAVGSAAQGDQFAKCCFAILTVWLMLTLPRHLAPQDMVSLRGARLVGAAAAGAAAVGIGVVAGDAPRALRRATARWAQAPMRTAAAGLGGGKPDPASELSLPAAPVAGMATPPIGGAGASGSTPVAGRIPSPPRPRRLDAEGYTLFVGSRLAERPLGHAGTAEEVQMEAPELAGWQRRARLRGPSGAPTVAARRAQMRLGAAYIAREGSELPGFDLAYVRSTRTDA